MLMHAQQQPHAYLYRKMMNDNKIGMEEAIDMRTLLFFPGGLELHIGVGGWVACMQGEDSPACSHG
jgi:hypothetical protein